MIFATVTVIVVPVDNVNVCALDVADFPEIVSVVPLIVAFAFVFSEVVEPSLNVIPDVGNVIE